MPYQESPWNEARVERLKHLVDKGYTARAIAAELAGGLTRCAVIGKCKRLKLKLKQPFGSNPKPVKRPAPMKAAPPPVLGIGFFELTGATCRYPLEGIGLAIRFCGRHSLASEPYCEAHMRLCYKDPPRHKGGDFVLPRSR